MVSSKSIYTWGVFIQNQPIFLRTQDASCWWKNSIIMSSVMSTTTVRGINSAKFVPVSSEHRALLSAWMCFIPHCTAKWGTTSLETGSRLCRSMLNGGVLSGRDWRSDWRYRSPWVVMGALSRIYPAIKSLPLVLVEFEIATVTSYVASLSFVLCWFRHLAGVANSVVEVIYQMGNLSLQERAHLSFLQHVLKASTQEAKADLNCDHAFSGNGDCWRKISA